VSFDGTVVLSVLTADCLPIVICSAKGPEIAALHCGWRSMAGGIIARTIDTLHSQPQDLMAWLGPAISQPAFEVGDDVRDVFLAGIEDAVRCFAANARGRWQADLFSLARLYLESAGVERIYGGGICTFADEARFYSYRRDGQCGRMATFICRNK
jgi:YfiH family protein